MNAFKRALAILIAMVLAQSASAALLSIAQYPLFLTHRTLPNVLVIYDNSESMDGTMAGKLIAGEATAPRCARRCASPLGPPGWIERGPLGSIAARDHPGNVTDRPPSMWFKVCM